MKKFGLLLVMFFFCGVSFAEESAQNGALCSLKITEDGRGQRVGDGGGQIKTIVAIDGKTIKVQEFLSQLWKRNRPLFKDNEMNSFGPDSSYHEIDFVCGDQKIIARSFDLIRIE